MSDTEFQDPLAVDPLAVVSQLNPPDPPQRFTVPAPPEPAPEPAAARGRPRGTKVTPLQRAMPNPERVKVGRRTKDGHLAHIGYFRWADLERLGSVEAFLKDYVVPAHSQPGVNEYELHYVRPDGTEQPAGMVVIEVAGAGVGPSGATSDPIREVQRVVQLTRDLQAEAQRQAPPTAPAPDPIEQMQRFFALQKQMNAGNDGGGQMAMFMMMQMMQQQREPAPRGPDPMELAMRIVEQTRPPPAPMLPPMPPPGPDPTTLLMLEMVKSQGAAMQAMMQAQMQAQMQGPRGPTPMELVQFAQSLTPKDTLGARDILPMMSTIKDMVRTPERDHLKDTLEAVQLLQRAVKSMSDEPRGGWRDFAEGILPKGIDSVTEMIQAIRQKETQGAVMGGPPQQQPAQQQQAFPPGFEEHTTAINRATTGSQAIEACLGAFFFLGQHLPQFRPSLETLIHHVRGGDREQALNFLEKFLEGLGEQGLVTQQGADRAMKAFEDHWDDVVAHIMGGPSPAGAGNAKPKIVIAPEPPPEHKLKSPPTVQ